MRSKGNKQGRRTVIENVALEAGGDDGTGMTLKPPVKDRWLPSASDDFS